MDFFNGLEFYSEGKGKGRRHRSGSMMGTCGNCKYFDFIDINRTSFGYCRKHPPIGGGWDEIGSISPGSQPITDEEFWCGEWVKDEGEED